MPCWITLESFFNVSEYCSLSGSDLLKEVPSLLWSCPGSTRASTAVLSQIEPTPGAVIAAQAVPEDCGTLPPFASFSDSTSEAVSVPCRATVMSAPIRVSRNGETDCLTETADEPFGLAFDDHDASAPAFFGALRPFAAGPDSGEASRLSWLQSSLLTSMSFMISASLTSGAVAVAAAGSSSSSSGGGVCVPAASIVAQAKPAWKSGHLAPRDPVEGVISRPPSQ